MNGPYSGDFSESLIERRLVLMDACHEPGVKGDRVSGATKQVTVETGLVVQVPLFVEEGDVIKVDTRTGEYQTRA